MLGDISVADEIYIVCGYTDMRRSIDGLCAIVQDRLHMDPRQRALYLFCGKRCDRLKALLWEGLSADFCYPHNCLVYVEKWVSIRNKCADKNVLSQTTNTCDFVIIRPLWFWYVSNDYSSDIYYFLFLCHGWKCIMVLGCLNACMPKN